MFLLMVGCGGFGDGVVEYDSVGGCFVGVIGSVHDSVRGRFENTSLIDVIGVCS